MAASGGSGGGGGGGEGGGGNVQLPQEQWSKGNLPASGHSTFGDQNFTDPMAQLARRIAELRGQSGALTNPAGAGPGVREELAMLSELYAKMQQQQDAKMAAMTPGPQAHSAGRMSLGGGMGGLGGGGGMGGGGGFGGFRRDEPRMETMLLDPYREMREASIKAATDYLKNPRPILSMKG